MTLADAPKLTDAWLAQYNDAVKNPNLWATQGQINQVMLGGSAVEAALDEAEYNTANKKDRLRKPLNWPADRTYYVPKTEPAGVGWFIVQAPDQSGVQRYWEFVEENGTALLYDDPQLHSGETQPKPALTADGYVTAADPDAGGKIADRYIQFWNLGTHAQAMTGTPKLASDNYSVRHFAAATQNGTSQFGNYVSHGKFAFGFKTADGGSFYILQLDQDPKAVVNEMMLGVTVPSTGTDIEEPAGTLAG
ncbi:hypothetical protein [Catenulispora sp. GP43]|uniref:hypothetical protein n=1 Tax=Catenulispora sp. GP43 TaxID=3156263 RepID=UPI0035119075